MPGFGHDCYVQIGRESVWGTSVAATRKFAVLSADFQPIRGKARSNSITNYRTRPAIHKGPQMARAIVELEADYGRMLHLWDAAMGTASYSSDGGTSSGGGPYTWTFKQLSVFNSYSMELLTNVPGSKCDQILGAKLNRLKFSGSVGLDSPPCRLATEWIGKSMSTNVVQTVIADSSTPLAVMPGHIDTAAFDAGTADSAGSDRLKSWEITIDNKLAERFYGADTIDEPVADDYADVTFKWTMEFTSKTAIDEYLANTSGNPTIKFTNGTQSIQFASASAYIVTPVNRPVNRWGILTQDFTYEAIYNSSAATGITITVVNSESTIS